MKQRSHRRTMELLEGSPHRIVLRVLLFAFLMVCVPVNNAQAEERRFKIIAHPSVSIEQLNLFQLRKLFSMKQTNWPGGQGVTVFVLNSKTAEHLDFCKSMLKMFPYQLDQVWNKLTYSGLGDPPITVNSLEEMLQRVSETPGAIGYIYADKETSGVVTITVGKG